MVAAFSGTPEPELSAPFSGHTAAGAGLAPGKLQCNLAILPASHALDFLRFCLRNPKPCPIVAVGETGDPMLSTLGRDIDVRTDTPRYRLYRDGRFEARSPTSANTGATTW
jgi:uncharacterized protein YcsI (UPF0317 family)